MRDNLTDITVVLDRSGSMESIRKDTIGGFNAFVTDQKTAPGFANLSLVQFDHEYTPVFTGKPLPEVPDLTHATFVPRGSTALLDALGRSIIDTGARLGAIPEAERPGKVMFVILTDGQENASREFTREKVFEMIEHQRTVYKWEFLYIGANQDAIQVGTSLGVAQGMSVNFVADAAGTVGAYSDASVRVRRYRSGSGGA